MTLKLSERIASDEFAQIARHPDHPKAFARKRKLPLPALIGALMSMRNQSQQAMLDGFFASVCGSPDLIREVSDRAFAKAREHLHLPALNSLNSLNDLVVRRADEAGDASVLMPAVRPCHLKRSAAAPDQRLFVLYLPGAELTLHASVHSASVGERCMLMGALDQLGPDDVLVLDCGYPATWLVALLSARGICFVMRGDNDSGWGAAKAFRRSSALGSTVTLNPPSAHDVRDWDCSAQAPSLRLVRQIAPNGQIRLLATKIDAGHCPAAMFGDLYHQRWRIEEAFKRIKHRLYLEAVSGLSQQALIIDVAAKILADKITSLMCAAAADHAGLPALSRKCNRAYAASFMQSLLPRLVLLVGDICSAIDHAIHALGSNSQRYISGRSRPRPVRHVKPHPSCAYKGCEPMFGGLTSDWVPGDT